MTAGLLSAQLLSRLHHAGAAMQQAEVHAASGLILSAMQAGAELVQAYNLHVLRHISCVRTSQSTVHSP